MPADPVADYLRTLNTSDRARAAAWDAVHNPDAKMAQQVLAQLPFADDVRANLWDLRQGGTLTGTPHAPKPASAEQFTEQFTEQAPTPDGSAVGRFASNFGQVFNPKAIAAGVATMGRAFMGDPNATLALVQPQIDAGQKAVQAYRDGRLSEAAGYGGAAAIPFLGPAAAAAGEQAGRGDIAGGMGAGAGQIAAVLAPGAIARAAPAIEGAASASARRLYQSALKPTKATLNDVRPAAGMSAQETLLQTGLNEGVPVTRGGMRKVETLIDSMNAEVQARVAKIQASGEKVDPKFVEQAINDVARDFTQQVNAHPDTAAIEAVRKNFNTNPHVAQQTAPAAPANFKAGKINPSPAQTQPGPIEPQTAQTMKRNTYQGLRGKYNTERGATIEAEKAGARGLRQGIEEAGQRAGVTDIADVNAREGSLISLEHALADAMRRRGNYDALGLKPAMGLTTAVATGSPLPLLATLVDRFPGLVSRTGIWINRGGRGARLMGSRAARAAVVGAATSPSESRTRTTAPAPQR